LVDKTKINLKAKSKIDAEDYFKSSSIHCSKIKYDIAKGKKRTGALGSKYDDSIKLEGSKLTLDLEDSETITFYLTA
jgi:hypothetical protein